MVTLEEKFYSGEHGFYFTVQTGLEMSSVTAGDVRSILRRENGSYVRRTIALSDIVDPTMGTVLMYVGSGDLAAPGLYSAQIWVRDPVTSRSRPSHMFRFEVVDGLTKGQNVFV